MDFSNVIDRRGTNSLKWDVAENELPMWVADMDFHAAPAIREAIEKRARLGVFGYSIVPDEFNGAIASWWRTRHGLNVENEWVVFATGVVPALSSVVRKLTTVGENVLIQPPVYNIFWNSIKNNGRNVVTNELLYDGRGYSIDYDDLEKKLSDPQTTMMILCNPQNPAGRIWSREELLKIGALARKHHVLVVSDEIHCDIVRPGSRYTPFASVSKEDAANCVVCVSPSKAFNLAGLQSAAVIVPDAVLRHKVTRGLNTDEVAEPNAFAIDAAIAAYTRGAAWLDELCAYVQSNKDYAAAFIKENIPCLSVPDSDATYLLWIDVSGLGGASTGFAKRLRAETGLFLSDGAVYGDNGRGFVRMNLACPLQTVKDGLNRLREGVERIT